MYLTGLLAALVTTSLKLSVQAYKARDDLSLQNYERFDVSELSASSSSISSEQNRGLLLWKHGRKARASRRRLGGKSKSTYKGRHINGKDGNEGDEGNVTKVFSKFTTDDFRCISKTVTEELSAHRDAEVHAAAISEAFSTACAKGADIQVSDFDAIFSSEDAFAFAHTMAEVNLRCFSNTKAYACVTVSATAEAWAEATAKAHAEAVSKAVAGCGCLTQAVTEAFTESSVHLQLVAKAASTATATVCSSGKGFVKARAYDSCVTKVFGVVFADATAEAITLGECLNSSAISGVLTEAGASFDAYSTCGATATTMQADPVVVAEEIALAEAARSRRRR